MIVILSHLCRDNWYLESADWSRFWTFICPLSSFCSLFENIIMSIPENFLSALKPTEQFSSNKTRWCLEVVEERNISNWIEIVMVMCALFWGKRTFISYFWLSTIPAYTKVRYHYITMFCSSSYSSKKTLILTCSNPCIFLLLFIYLLLYLSLYLLSMSKVV